MFKSLFNKIDGILQTVIVWIVASSKDADRVSLSVKMALLGFIPYIMQTIGMACGLGVVCLDVEVGTLELLGQVISDIVFYTLSLISIFGTAIGMIRKIWRTVTGEHEGLEVL